MAIELNNRSLITLYGGSGFLGRHIVRALAKTGARMRVAVRRPELAGHLQPLGGVGQINAVQANVRFPESLRAAAEGADAIVNLVGILVPRGKQSFAAINDEGARHVAERRARCGGEDLRPCLGDRRRSQFSFRLWTDQGRRREGGARDRSERNHPSPLDRVRPGGRFLQSLRRARTDFAGAAVDRGRQDKISAGIRGRRCEGRIGRAHRRSEAWRALRTRRAGSADPERGDAKSARLHDAKADAHLRAFLARETARRDAPAFAEPATDTRPGADARS